MSSIARTSVRSNAATHKASANTSHAMPKGVAIPDRPRPVRLSCVRVSCSKGTGVCVTARLKDCYQAFLENRGSRRGGDRPAVPSGI